MEHTGYLVLTNANIPGSYGVFKQTKRTSKKMEDFIEYQRFQTLNDAAFLIDLLDANQISFKIDDSATRFDMAATAINPLEGGIVLKIRQSDKVRVDQINFTTTETASINDHFMYSLSDDDIIDVIVNPEDWTDEEISLAKEISKQRELKPTAELIKSLRIEKKADYIKEQIEQQKEQTKQTKLISGGASWFLMIGILSGLNITTVIFHQNLHFVTGLGLNYAILGMMEGIRRTLGVDLMSLGFILSFLFSGLFIWIWRKSKQKNKNVYLSGLIIYGLDTLLFIFTKEWYSLAFHLFALLGLFAGFNALLKSIKETKYIEEKE